LCSVDVINQGKITWVMHSLQQYSCCTSSCTKVMGMQPVSCQGFTHDEHPKNASLVRWDLSDLSNMAS